MMRLREFDSARVRGAAQARKQLTGINLSDRTGAGHGRLARRLRALQLQSFAEYRHVLAHDGGRRSPFCMRSHNLTAFSASRTLRYLREQVLAPWSTAATPRRLRIWSAGCSTGE